MNTGVPGQDFPGSDLGMAVQVLENRNRRETMHPMGAGFTLVFVKLAPFNTDPSFQQTMSRWIRKSTEAMEEIWRLRLTRPLKGITSPPASQFTNRCRVIKFFSN